jgi:hypothetical protein
MPQKTSTRIHTCWLALLLAFSGSAYDDIPHSASAIRDAYFLGVRQGSLTPEFLARYAHWIPELKDGTICTSQATLGRKISVDRDEVSSVTSLIEVLGRRLFERLLRPMP